MIYKLVSVSKKISNLLTQTKQMLEISGTLDFKVLNKLEMTGLYQQGHKLLLSLLPRDSLESVNFSDKRVLNKYLSYGKRQKK